MPPILRGRSASHRRMYFIVICISLGRKKFAEIFGRIFSDGAICLHVSDMPELGRDSRARPAGSRAALTGDRA